MHQLRKQRLRLKLGDRTRTRKRRKPTGFEYNERQSSSVEIMEITELSPPSTKIAFKTTESSSTMIGVKRRHHLFNDKTDNKFSVSSEPANDNVDRKNILPLTSRRFVRDTIKDFQVSAKEFNVLECIINGNSGLVDDDHELKAIAEKFAVENVKTFFNS